MTLLGGVAVLAAAALMLAWFFIGGALFVFTALALAVAAVALLWWARRTDPAPASSGDTVEAPGGPPVWTDGNGAGTVATVRPPPAPRTARPDGFPIAAYDELWVTQIVPLVAEMEESELAAVESREREGRSRAGVLVALDERRRALADPDEAVDHDPAVAGPPRGNDVDDDVPPAPAAPSVATTPAPDPGAVMSGLAAGRILTFLGRPAAPLVVRPAGGADGAGGDLGPR